MTEQQKPAAAFDSLINDISEIGPIEVGQPPRTKFARWCRVPEPDLSRLPSVKRYTCLRAPNPIAIDGRLNDPAWSRANWSEPFGMIHDGSPTPLETRVALLWDDQYLYAGYKVQDPDIRAVMTDFNDHIYFKDEDVEFFFDAGTHYYEVGLNAVNCGYQIRWTWVQHLVEQQRYKELEELFKCADFLYYVARSNDKIGRHADLNFQLPGIKHATFIDGTVNCPAVRDNGWTVTIAFPWSGLRSIDAKLSLPPRPGSEFRMTAYRCHHDRQNNKVKGWTWSIMGNDNIHTPERWNLVTLSDKTA